MAEIGGQVARQGLEDNANQRDGLLGAAGREAAVDDVRSSVRAACQLLEVGQIGVESFEPVGRVPLQQFDHYAVSGLRMDKGDKAVDTLTGFLVDQADAAGA